MQKNYIMYIIILKKLKIPLFRNDIRHIQLFKIQVILSEDEKIACFEGMAS